MLLPAAALLGNISLLGLCLVWLGGATQGRVDEGLLAVFLLVGGLAVLTAAARWLLFSR
jgi:hypothetical protein